MIVNACKSRRGDDENFDERGNADNGGSGCGDVIGRAPTPSSILPSDKTRASYGQAAILCRTYTATCEFSPLFLRMNQTMFQTAYLLARYPQSHIFARSYPNLPSRRKLWCPGGASESLLSSGVIMPKMSCGPFRWRRTKTDSLIFQVSVTSCTSTIHCTRSTIGGSR